jgi:hypothetical protein
MSCSEVNDGFRAAATKNKGAGITPGPSRPHIRRPATALAKRTRAGPFLNRHRHHNQLDRQTNLGPGEAFHRTAIRAATTRPSAAQRLSGALPPHAQPRA